LEQSVQTPSGKAVLLISQNWPLWPLQLQAASRASGVEPTDLQPPHLPKVAPVVLPVSAPQVPTHFKGAQQSRASCPIWQQQSQVG